MKPVNPKDVDAEFETMLKVAKKSGWFAGGGPGVKAKLIVGGQERFYCLQDDGETWIRIPDGWCKEEVR